MQAVCSTTPRKPAASAHTVESKRTIGKRDRELIVRHFTNSPDGVEPSAYAAERMEGRYTEAEIDRVMVAELDLRGRVIKACEQHASGFYAYTREVRLDTMSDLAEAV